MFNFGVCSHPNYRSNHIVTLPFYQYIPVISDVAKYLGVISSDYQTIKKTLQKGESVSLMLGGVREMNLTQTNKMTIYVKQRKGIFKMAAESGIPLVPVITYGENELFPRAESAIITSINEWLHSTFRLSIPVPSWKSLINWFEISYKPLKPVKTYIGGPITHSDPDILKEKYILALRELFDKTSPPDYILEII